MEGLKFICLVFLWNFGVVEVNAKDTSCFWLNQLQENCADFPEGVFDKIHDERIVGGIEADIGEIQWQANLAYKDELDQFCGGTLLCDRFVLTAAHCVENEASDNIVVILGDHNKENENDPYEITNDVKKIILHPKYVPETSNDNSYNDIALLQLSKPVRNKKGIRSACLPKYEPNFRTEMLITGWGRVRPEGPGSEVLLKAKVDLISRNKCKEMYGKDGGNVTDRMICASSPGKDTCQGDSGGPLVIKNNKGKAEVVGITSWGFGCANPYYPGVYTNVAKYIYWIVAMIRQNPPLEEKMRYD